MYYIVFTITDTNDIEFLKSIVYKSALDINDIELIITDMTEEIKNDFIVERGDADYVEKFFKIKCNIFDNSTIKRMCKRHV